VGSMQLLALFDVEPDRRLVFLEHAGVHRKGELLALRLQGSGERGKRAVGPAVGPFPEQPDVFVARIERADGELRAVEVFWSAGGDGRPSASANETKENSQSGEAAAPRHGRSILQPDSCRAKLAANRRISARRRIAFRAAFRHRRPIPTRRDIAEARGRARSASAPTGRPAASSALSPRSASAVRAPEAMQNPHIMDPVRRSREFAQNSLLSWI